MIAIRVYLYIYPDEGGNGIKMPLDERVSAIKKVLPVFVIFAIIMSGLYLGFFTATESAAVGVMLVILLLMLRGDLTIKLLRGNVGTRIQKLNEGLFDAVILAKAGLDRLNIDEGKIIQVGTHQTLKKTEGYYKDLYRKQRSEKEM